jgi:hypothetical protein
LLDRVDEFNPPTNQVDSNGIFVPSVPRLENIRICNLRKVNRFRSKLVSIISVVTSTQSWTNALAYHEICTLMLL